MKFNWDEFLNQDNKIAVHCKTEEEAEDFCEQMSEHGLKWVDGDSYSECYYHMFKSETCYNNKGKISSRVEYLRQSFKIYEWSDYMNEEFTKSDLRSGDVVMRRDGSVAIVCIEAGALIYRDGYDPLANFSRRLTFKGIDCYDIIKVYRPQAPCQCQFAPSCYTCGELVYDRDAIEKERSERCKEIEELEKSFNEIAKLHNCTVKVKEAEEKRE